MHQTNGNTIIPQIHIVGGGIMGILAAIDIMTEALHQELNITVTLYEADSFGGGHNHLVTTPKSHLWLHTDGQLYVKKQDVCLSLQRSTQHLKSLVPHVFEGIFEDKPCGPLAIVVEKIDNEETPITDFYDAMGIWYRPILPSVIDEFFPELTIPTGSQIYRVRDTVINLPRLIRNLLVVAKKLGVKLINERVETITIKGDRINQVIFEDKKTISIADTDHVVLSIGASTPTFLAKEDLSIPNLRLFQSHLVATDVFDLNLLALVHEGVNLVPQQTLKGTHINVFGNYHRRELTGNEITSPLRIDQSAVEGICKDVEEWFGLKIPSQNRMVWAAIKTEISDNSQGSRNYQIQQIEGIDNYWLALPGKLSQSAACSLDLAAKLCRVVCNQLDYRITHPIWDSGLTT